VNPECFRVAVVALAVSKSARNSFAIASPSVTGQCSTSCVPERGRRPVARGDNSTASADLRRSGWQSGKESQKSVGTVPRPHEMDVDGSPDGHPESAFKSTAPSLHRFGYASPDTARSSADMSASSCSGKRWP
jgi:hypothetical protein